MARGGARQGAGRKRGQPNKIHKEAQVKALASGISPLDYMLTIMRDDGREASMRLDAAKAAAPYVHARLATVEHTGNEDKPLVHTVRWER